MKSDLLRYTAALDLEGLKDSKLSEPVRRATEYLTKLPPAGTPVAELTERDKVAIAFHAGVECSLVTNGLLISLRTLQPVAIFDSGDGKWSIAIGQDYRN